MRTRVFFMLSMALSLIPAVRAAAPHQVKVNVPKETQKTAETALRKGAEFLLLLQNPDGSWGKYKMPSITSLCVMALKDAPVKDISERDKAIDAGLKSIVSFAQEDGSIAPPPQRVLLVVKMSNYANYNTALSLLALATFNRPEHVEIMKRARNYLKKSQIKDPNSAGYGGFGYARGKKADLSNTSWAAEALYFTEFLDREPYAEEGESLQAENKEMRQALERFLNATQNLPEDQEVEPDNEDADGGFGYRSGLVSTGSITYAGLKSMVYAQVDRQDPRVKGALEFARNHYTVQENPGQELKGYFYYLQTMAKALDATGIKELKTPDDRNIPWRQDIIQRLAELQAENGGWVNTDGRYMESMPELASSFAMISIKFALGRGPQRR